MKKYKKTFVMVLALMLTAGSFGACGQDDGGLDETKTQLNVGIFDAGLGTAWANSTARAFEECYKNVSFEDGKMGVQVVFDPKKNEFGASNLSVTMEFLDNAMYILDFSDIDLFRSKGLLSDITKVVSEKVYDEDGNLAATTKKEAVSSINDIMDEQFLGFYDREGKTYAIPHWAGVSGIIYDADLFDSKGYYFFKNGQLGAKQADIDLAADGDIGYGPDGVVGTTDDGLPATYDAFKRLLVQMGRDNVIPFTWSSDYAYQRRFGYQSVWANYQGANDFALNFSFNGETSKGEKVDETNALSIIAEQEGRKTGIQFFYDIIKGGYYSSNAFSQSYTDVQFEYIDSVNTNAPIAMFFEGGYWENEARSTFDYAAQFNSEMGYGKRNFRLMAIPNFEGQPNTDSREVLIGNTQTAAVLIAEKNACQNAEVQKKLAGLFMQFMHTREQLVNFTRDTGGCFKVYDFEPTKEELASWTKFGQNIYSYMSDGANMVLNIPKAAKWQRDYTKCEEYISFHASGYADPATYFYNNKNATVNDCYAIVKNSILGL